MHVHLAMSSSARTSSTSMIFATIHRYLEAFGMGMTSGVSSHLHLSRVDDLTPGLCRVDNLIQSEGSSGFVSKGEPWFWNLYGLRPASPTVAPHRRGSILMSRSCDSCEEIPLKTSPSLFGIQPLLGELR
jgi:hypothetical protein